MSAQTRAVTAGLVTGDRVGGVLERFDESDRALHLMVTAGNGGRAPMTLPMSTLAWVALHRRAGEISLETKGLREVRAHMPGGQLFHVAVDVADLQRGPGFYGVPMDPNSPFWRVWCARDRVLALEQTEPIGAQLVAEGLVPGKSLQEGLQRQRSGRQVRLGDLLVSLGLVSADEVQAALKRQRDERERPLGDLLVEMGVMTEAQLTGALARKFHLPIRDLKENPPNPDARRALPGDLLARFRVLPIEISDDELVVALDNPLAFDAIEAVRFAADRPVREVLVTPSQLRDLLGEAQDLAAAGSAAGGGKGGKTERFEAILKDLERQAELELNPGSGVEDDPTRDGSDLGIIGLVNRIVVDAYELGASDIHVEPGDADHPCLVRLRIDGACRRYQEIPQRYARAMVSRIKIMARLDISERRKPQDGKIRFRTPQLDIELRIATVPTVGDQEDVVMRLLASSKPLPLGELGLLPDIEREVDRLIHRPHGLFLCVGPTGSGKTTTLHSALKAINVEGTKIWTAEDPVEITQHGLRQVQVQSQIGFTFAAALRSFLRADPDVIMIGEMRDHETAHMAVESALTGHLVVSTLHTNSAPETITRLLDMQLDPFSFADSLVGVLAQRLGRTLCKHCKQPYEAEGAEIAALRHAYGEQAWDEQVAPTLPAPLILQRAPGCERCNGTGIKGRIAVHELLVADNDVIRGAVARRATVGELRALAQAQGMRTLVQDGVLKVLSGKTSLPQVLTVCAAG